MISLLVTLALAGAIGFLFGYALASSKPRPQLPVPYTTLGDIAFEAMNETEALRAKVRKSDAEASKLRHGLGLIGLYVCSQKSGTAQKVLRMVQDALS